MVRNDDLECPRLTLRRTEETLPQRFTRFLGVRLTLRRTEETVRQVRQVISINRLTLRHTEET